MARAINSSTVQVGWSCFMSAIEPAICGVAEDVPLNKLTSLPRSELELPTPFTATPTTSAGAVMSGFKKLLPYAGPREL